MTDKIHEQISALLDGELSQAESEMLFRRMENDAELRAVWQRYAMIHDAIHREVPEQFDTGFSSRVMDAIHADAGSAAAGDSTVDGTRAGVLGSGLNRLLKPVAGLAVAASVAAMAIIGLQNINGVLDSGEGVSVVAGKADPSGFMKVSGTRWEIRQPEVAAKLNGYLVNHNEFSSSTNFDGILQYRHIVGYDQEQKNKVQEKQKAP